MFLVEHGKGKKRIRSLEPMYLRFAALAEQDPQYLLTYCREQLGLVEPKILIPEILFNTLMEIRGFRVWLTGRSGTAQIVGIQAFQMVLPPEQEQYLKKVLRACERLKAARGDLEITQAQNRVSTGENLALYDLLLEKMQIPVYSQRPSSQVKTLTTGRDKFIGLDLTGQCRALAAILALFRGNGKTDLTGIGGSKVAGTILFSRNVPSDFKIFYSSVTGFYSHEDSRLRP